MIINFIYTEIVYMTIVTFYTENFTYWRGLVLSLRSCEYWSAVLTSRPPGDISVRIILKLFFSCAIWGLVICSCCQYQLFQFSSDLVFFSDFKAFWPWCITLGRTTSDIVLYSGTSI
jgi:hypothetical protein